LEIGGTSAERVQHIAAMIRDNDDTRLAVIRDFYDFAEEGAEKGISGDPSLPDRKVLHPNLLDI
jgi:hypothetical protein